jgi:hypothetical protein
MKKGIATSIIIHPLTQLISFVIIILCGEEFGAPLGWYIYIGLLMNELFAWLGLMGMALNLLSLMIYRNLLQPLSLLLMWSSLLVFMTKTTAGTAHDLFSGVVPVITSILFIIISALFINEKIKWKNS